MTTVSTWTGLSLMYWIDTWDLESGRRKSRTPLLRTSDSLCTSLCAKRIDIGISSGVSLQAKPNMSPWSPAPCSLYIPSPSVTPCEMSGDCLSMEVRTAQVSQSKPIAESL